VQDWEFEDLWDWEDQNSHELFLYEVARELATRFFLSDNDFVPSDEDDYHLGHLGADDWWPLVNQLDDTVDWGSIALTAAALDKLVGLAGLPTELLEDPYVFLGTVLEGNLPWEPSGRRVGSPKLVKIALISLELMGQFPEPARSAVRAWADVHRSIMFSPFPDEYDLDGLADLLDAAELPPAVSGFSMMITLTLMLWPDRAEGISLPPGFADPEHYDDLLVQWESLDDNPTVTEEGTGAAEAFFAQGQLAYTLAEIGTIEPVSSTGTREDMALIYSQLSRAILWIHNQCRSCPERVGVTCQVASSWPERPVPLVDIAGEMAGTGRIEGCIKS
jgi:hypothetical protein